MTVEDYRANYLREQGDAAAGADPTDPLGAALPEGGRADPGRAARSDHDLLAGVADTRTTTAARIAAIDTARLDAITRPEVVRALIAVLSDQADVPEVRRAAQGALEELSFAMGEFAPHDADFRSALRIAATDRDAQLAEGALEVLALGQDEYAQRLLVEGLEDPSKALVSRPRALQFLGYDLHTGLFPMLRRIAEERGDPHERVAALRILAADAGSAEVFERIVADRSEDVRVRTTSAIALHAMDPDAFAPTAHEIVLDPDDDDDLRAVCLTALTVVPEGARSEGGDLADAVLSTPTPPSPELARAAEQYRTARSR